MIKNPQIVKMTREGFTLVEVLVTVVILAFGCLAVLMMQSSSLKGNSKADNITVATFLAESEIERIKAMPFADLTAEIDAASGGKITKKMDRNLKVCPSTESPACTAYNYEVETTFYKKFPTSFSHQADIKVTWRDHSGPQSLVYTTVATDLDL
jgi:type IV pilus modification protein PilV